MDSSPRRRKKIIKKHKKSEGIRVQRDLFWMRRAAGMNYRKRLSGYSGILLIISIDVANRLRYMRDLKGGGWWRSQKTQRFWDR